MPLPDANNYSTRIYELLKETDLENLSYSQFQSVAETLFIEPENEDEMRRLILIQLARMAVRGSWDGFLTGAGAAPVTSLVAGTDITLSPVSGLGDVTINAAASPVTSLIAGTNLTLSPVSGLGDVTINADTQTSPVTSLVAGTNVTLSPVSGLGDVTINAAGSTGIGGSITNDQIARGATLANDIEGSNGLLFDGTSLTVNTLTASDPVLNLASSTKSVSLEVNTSEKLSVKGSSDSFVFDASSATGGITFPDSTVQNTAAIAAPVTSLVAGTNVTLSPVSGLGDVTINAAASPVTSLVAGANITLSPVSGLGNVTITAAGGGTARDNYAQEVATSQGLSVPGYFLMGAQNIYTSIGGVAYNTGQSGFMNKWTAPSTGTSGISIGLNISYGGNHYLWCYETSSTGYAGTFIGKIKLPGTGTSPAFMQENQWTDATGTNITSPTFTKGQQYVSVLEFNGAQNYFGENRHYQNFTPVVNAGQFTSTSEFFGMRYTGTISATLSDVDIDFMDSNTGWPLIGLEL